MIEYFMASFASGVRISGATDERSFSSVPPLLVKDDVNRGIGLTGWTITNDKFTSTMTDRNYDVDELDTAG